jgi:pimeloyl-ACP methyl ester carboxylesterase
MAIPLSYNNFQDSEISVMTQSSNKVPAPPAPFVVEAGSGPGVVCVHANASTSSQWRPLIEALKSSFHVLAPDTYGAGKSPAWPTDRVLTLRDEVALLESVFARAGVPFTLVAHSYGAAIALVAALDRPERIRALAVYEPTLFGLIDAESPPPNDAEGIRQVAASAATAIDAGDRDRAAEVFIDFWMPGTWKQTPASRRGPIANAMVPVRGWATALFSEPTPLAKFAELKMPVLFMMGKQSPPSSRSVGQLLIPVLPRVEVVEFDGLGHMGPVTHPTVVNAAISDFLMRL